MKHIEYNRITQRTESSACARVRKAIPGRGCTNRKRLYMLQETVGKVGKKTDVEGELHVAEGTLRT